MSLDGDYIRSEAVAPYNWNQTSQPEDEVLNNLSIGEHTLTAKATSVDGLMYEVSVTITIKALPRDCNGDINGTAYRDECEECVGGNTGKEACEEDCHGDWGGTASIDDCGLCSGGNTGKPVNDCITAINAIDNDRLEIYPIPATDKLNLSKSVSWRLVDIFGNQLKEGKSESISLIEYSPGIYFLMVGGKTYRIIKE